MKIESGGGFGFSAQSKRMNGAKKKNENSLAAILEKLSTGKSINKSADNAAGLAISEQLNTQVRGYKVAGRNVGDAMSALNISDGATNEISSLLQRQRQLASQARNGTMNSEGRAALDLEFQQLSAEVDRIAESTSFNGQKLVNGTDLGAGDSEIVAGANGETIAMPGVNVTTAALGSSGISISSVAGAEAAMGALSLAFDSLSQQRSDIGASSNRFESVVNTLQTAEVNTTAAESAIRDQDMAEGISKMVRDQILNSAGNSAFSMFNRISGDHIQSLLQ